MRQNERMTTVCRSGEYYDVEPHRLRSFEEGDDSWECVTLIVEIEDGFVEVHSYDQTRSLGVLLQESKNALSPVCERVVHNISLTVMSASASKLRPVQ